VVAEEEVEEEEEEGVSLNQISYGQVSNGNSFAKE
jgi:hypothetical protein